MRIKVRVDSEKTSDEFKGARKDINRRTREGLVDAGKKAILPHVRAGAPGVVRNALTTRATSRRGYVTVQGRRLDDRIAGLLNFGGTVRTPIEPTKKSALTIGDTGEVRASVTRPRFYRGEHFIEKGIERGVPEMERIMLPTMMRIFDGLPHTP